MRINFHRPECQTSTDAVKFGLCDDQDQTKAYVDYDSPTKWIAIVENPNRKPVVFTAVDHCILIERQNREMEKRCDGILTFPNHLVFIELKDKQVDWIETSAEQVRQTIQLYRKNHAFDGIGTKIALLANKKHPRFHRGRIELKERFFDETQVALVIENTLVI